MLKKRILMLLGLFILVGTLTACQSGSNNGRSITAVGSSALQPLVEAVGENYASAHSGNFINVQGGGTGTGLSQIQEGAVDIGNSDLYAEQKKGINAKKLVDHKVAVVGITPVINKQLAIKNLTKKQLIGIFTGDITNWQQVGGPDRTIVVINRAQGSGTRSTFERWALNGQSSLQAQEQDSTGMVRQIVASTPGAISYMAFAYVDKTIKTVNVDNIQPTNKNVETNRWPIWSYEHMYTRGQPKGLTKDFIDYMMSDSVQEKVVGKLGYIPMSQMKTTRTLNDELHITK
ncbi:phosphate transport system substrate-binding protein [Agrilactobacillus composti DSM 18527 = JCM 14202]|uniref:Phosphate-binding protein n=1 Tax=Agrilactobacillus composti DSM 18527 = JCM 14202 TaxID=1423734 RepID=X0PUL6_9LACO|nr:phosphate ABC transporter substrate-binding protein PstS family protein [Agrilactobacillus composti]KRM31152.1 phosphate transport system substrate-binding protein [Agrilactobacillus composti DSM 18527 = JCM 14202]GAF41086.1 phosphate ABC transporter, periplasmic phosphate-binding protein PstS [Agrilactobacillus composti DSM 18527 = JCM 14202]